MKPHVGPASAGEQESFMTPNDKVGGQGIFPVVPGKAEGPIHGVWGPFTRRGGWTGEGGADPPSRRAVSGTGQGLSQMRTKGCQQGGGLGEAGGPEDQSASVGG